MSTSIRLVPIRDDSDIQNKAERAIQELERAYERIQNSYIDAVNIEKDRIANRGRIIRNLLGRD